MKTLYEIKINETIDPNKFQVLWSRSHQSFLSGLWEWIGGGGKVVVTVEEAKRVALAKAKKYFR